jgi:uncharacterized protein YbjT (DUF2867 family)
MMRGSGDKVSYPVFVDHFTDVPFDGCTAISFMIKIKTLETPLKFNNKVGPLPVKKTKSQITQPLNADVLIAGSTGLIGSAFLNLIGDDPSTGKTIALARQENPAIADKPHIRQEIIDFANLGKYRHLFSARTLVCALGTTIKKAGSKEKFRQVDYQLPMDIATFASENGCKIFILISAIGANPDSSVFYNKVKGELERDIQKLSFKAVHIIRPSLLMGDREEFRLGEEIGKRLIQPFSFLVPDKFKPIHVDVIARKIKTLLKDDTPGTHIYEGRQIHKP